MSSETASGTVSTSRSFGQPIQFDPKFTGPAVNRSCTDVIFLLLFVFVMFCWAIISIYAFTNGEPARLLLPTDSEGQKCSLSSEVKDKPYLFFFDFCQCVKTGGNIMSSCPTPQVCRKECPTEYFYYKLYTESYDPDWDELNVKIICKAEVERITDKKTLQYNIDNGLCAPWHLKSAPVYGRCLPVFNADTEKYVKDLKIEGVAIEKLFEGAAAMSNLRKSVKEFGKMVVQDMTIGWPYILVCLVISTLLSIAYIFLMRWFPCIMVWFTLGGVIAVLCYCIALSFINMIKVGNEDVKTKLRFNVEDIYSEVDEDMYGKGMWLVLMIISMGVLVAVLLLTLCLRSRIRIAIALLAESARAVGSMMSTLLFPLVPWILQAILIIFFICTGLYLASAPVALYQVSEQIPNTGSTSVTRNCSCTVDYKIGDPCVPEIFRDQCDTPCNMVCQYSKEETSNFNTFLQWLNIFCFLWSTCFVSALGEMILALAFSTWYWTFDKDQVPTFIVTISISRVLRYHMGTVAFGALILAICQLIRVILEYLEYQLNKFDNVLVRGVLCCLQCFFWCLEQFIKFMNRNAYIMCAIHGKNFCVSAKNAFNLLMRNMVRVLVINKLAVCMLFIGKMLVIALSTIIAYYILSSEYEFPSDKVKTPKLNYYFIPVAMVGFFSYFITHVFFGVYTMAVDTLFLCFLEDIERNNGSAEKPYYMPENLLNILGKRNRFN